MNVIEACSDLEKLTTFDVFKQRRMNVSILLQRFYYNHFLN